MFLKKNGKQTLSVESIEVSIGYLCIWLKELPFDKKKNTLFLFGSRGPFLESPGNLTGPKPYYEI